MLTICPKYYERSTLQQARHAPISASSNFLKVAHESPPHSRLRCNLPYLLSMVLFVPRGDTCSSGAVVGPSEIYQLHSIRKKFSAITIAQYVHTSHERVINRYVDNQTFPACCDTHNPESLPCSAPRHIFLGYVSLPSNSSRLRRDKLPSFSGQSCRRFFFISKICLFKHKYGR